MSSEPPRYGRLRQLARRRAARPGPGGAGGTASRAAICAGPAPHLAGRLAPVRRRRDQLGLLVGVLGGRAAAGRRPSAGRGPDRPPRTSPPPRPGWSSSVGARVQLLGLGAAAAGRPRPARAGAGAAASRPAPLFNPARRPPGRAGSGPPRSRRSTASGVASAASSSWIRPDSATVIASKHDLAGSARRPGVDAAQLGQLGGDQRECRSRRGRWSPAGRPGARGSPGSPRPRPRPAASELVGRVRRAAPTMPRSAAVVLVADGQPAQPVVDAGATAASCRRCRTGSSRRSPGTSAPPSIVPTRGTVTCRSAIAVSSVLSVSSGARLNSSM